MAEQLKKHILLVLAAALFVVSGTAVAITSASASSELDAQQAGIESLESEVEAARAATADLEAEASSLLSGADPERVARDSEPIEDLVRRAMTWSDNAEYTEARESTMRVHGLEEGSTFMTSFLPPAPVSTDAEGNQYPYIDAAGLNSSVGDLRVRALGVSVLDYRYMVLVDVRSESGDGMATAVNTATVFVTVDGDGALSDISGYASTTALRYSE